MKARSRTVFGYLLHFRERLRKDALATKRAGDEPPLRSGPSGAPDRLLARLAENEDVLIGACGLLTAAVKANRRIAPAGEWLLDNFYLIEEQIRTARRHLPKGYSREHT